MVSAPVGWISPRRMKSLILVGCDSVRVIPPNCTAAQAPTFTLTNGPVGVGLPAVIPNGPYVLKAWRLALAGKQPSNLVNPAGVGVKASVWKRAFLVTLSSSNPPKKKTLFFFKGPPIVKPANSSLNLTGLV